MAELALDDVHGDALSCEFDGVRLPELMGRDTGGGPGPGVACWGTEAVGQVRLGAAGG
jgi:hypothetical protein